MFGIEISDNFRKFTIDEKFLAYSSICSASEKVYILRHDFEFDGTQTEESVVFSKIKNIFPKSVVKDESYLPETLADGFDMLAKGLSDNNDESALLMEYYLNQKDYKWRVETLKNSKIKVEHKLDSLVLDKIFSNDIYLSASKIEVYNKCPFSYFCRHVLKLSKLQKAELDVLQRGTIVHYVLEKVLKTFGEKISFADREEIETNIHLAMNEYLQNIKGYQYLQIPRFEFLFKEIEKMLCHLILHISNEFKNSDFVPKAFELNISDYDGDVPALKLDFSKDKRAIITGQIDRVDIFKDADGNEFVRVIDYKTGNPNLNIKNVEYGLDMQLPVYIYLLKNFLLFLFRRLSRNCLLRLHKQHRFGSRFRFGRLILHRNFLRHGNLLRLSDHRLGLRCHLRLRTDIRLRLGRGCRHLIVGLNTSDTNLVQGAVLTIAVAFVVVNILVDVLYVLINPRIRTV